MTPTDNFMAPFPVLEKLAGDRWHLWKKSLAREIGQDGPDLQSYLPLWLKKNSKAQGLAEFWTDLADFEWSKFWVAQNLPPVLKGSGEKLSLNPFNRILRLSFDLVPWFETSHEAPPSKRAHVLLISANGQFEASFEMAAIIDELGEEPLTRTQLVMELEKKQGPRDWASPIEKLISGKVILF
jgi:hypothetical protein